VLFGEPDCGKTSFLRLLTRRLVTSHAKEDMRILLVDHRRGLLGAVPPEHLAGYGGNLTTTTTMVAELAEFLRQRLPGTDVTPEQLRTRGWWSGPEIFVVVDDYDLVVGQTNNPLLPLLDLLPQARDIGLHVVLARRTGGAGRALFDPVISRMRDVGALGLLMSGSKDEGPLLGGLKAEALPAGRGRLITRRGAAQLVQLAHLPPEE
jgi:S-DNA-T family DNA segregation ATPase FtsK/SpoIIIE